MFIFSKNRAGAACAITGVVALFVGTLLHPMQADPNQAAAAFKEYAADHLWVASHLTQLAGVALMVISLLLLAAQLRNSKGSTLAWIGAAAALVSLALAAALQAVDGIALRNMVNAWANAGASQKEMVFQATFAVRQIEIGLASLFCLFMGITACLFGGALFNNPDYSKSFAGLAIAGGAFTFTGGMAMAYTGFSDLTMTLNMPANLILLVWMLMLGVKMWRSDTT